MNKMKFLMAALCVTTGSLFTACHDNEIDNNPDNQEVARTYRLTANANKAVSTDGTSRALVQDGSNPKGLKSAWLLNDAILALPLADSSGTNTGYGMIRSLRPGQASLFEGEINPHEYYLTRDSYLCFLYPGDASKGTSRTITPVTRIKEDNSNYYHETTDKDKITNRVELNMSQQDGTVETISKRFDFQWKKVKPSRIDRRKVNVSIGNMERVVSFWGLRFTDKNNQILTNIDSVYISNVKGTDVFNLGTGKFEEHNLTDETWNIVITPPAGKKISSAGGKYTYVAMFPGTYKNVLIMAYVGNTCYMREYSSLTFDANKTYHSDLLQMKEPKREPYVKVQGVKWAMGNFIHYGPKDGGYWGIAPAQWWISRRAIMLDRDGKQVWSGGKLGSSQFEKSPTQYDNDADLFRRGEITAALDTKQYGTVLRFEPKEIEYDTRGLIDSYKGDIVWYYTRFKNQKYRMPSEKEMQTLYEEADVIPAYCYTDKGTIVYGGYFTTSGWTRTNGFPKKRNNNYKYSNVTALVRANKGLFLPLGGRILDNEDKIGDRYVYGKNGIFYGQYMSASKSLQVKSLLFGNTEFSFIGLPFDQKASIRPVWDELSTTETDPVYPDFQNIK